MAAALAAAITLAWVVEWWLSANAYAYEVVVRRDDSVLATFGFDELKTFEQGHIVVLGKRESGPSVLTVLQHAGVESFESIRVVGPGIRDDGDLSLASEEVTPGVLLDLANRGTVKIVGPAIAWDDRVRDVTEIIVEGGE